MNRWTERPDGTFTRHRTWERVSNAFESPNRTGKGGSGTPILFDRSLSYATPRALYEAFKGKRSNNLSITHKYSMKINRLTEILEIGRAHV